MGILKETKRVWDRTTLDVVILFVTSRCNFKCGFCLYADSLNQKGDLDLEAMVTMARTIPKFQYLLISGGEPFLRKDLKEILLAFREHAGVRSVDIPTNGWYQDRILAFVDDLLGRDPGMQLTISLSLDGMGEVNDRARGVPGGYERSIGTLAALAKLKAKHAGLRLKVGSVLTTFNAESLEALLDYIREEHPAVDEHTLEIVRDLDLERADYAAKRALTDDYRRLCRKSYMLYGQGPGRRKRKKDGVPGMLSGLTFPGIWAHAVDVKVNRIHGELWPFPCLAGRTILTISSKGQLAACELRKPPVELKDFGFDVSRAMESEAYRDEVARIEKERCDCTHGCFIHTSIAHSGNWYVKNVPLRGAMEKLRHRIGGDE